VKKLLIVYLVFSFYQVKAQDSLQLLNQNREHIKMSGMSVLGSWSVANLAIGLVGASNATGQNKYFYQMDAIWGAVNLGAAISGYISAVKNTDKPRTAAEALKEQKKIETIFLVNGGLDVAYIGTGIYLNHRGDTQNSDKLRGYGEGIITQGVFLLLFDATMYSTERHNGNKLRHFLERNPLMFDGKKVGMVINF
jgi:hypothetical protein